MAVFLTLILLVPVSMALMRMPEIVIPSFVIVYFFPMVAAILLPIVGAILASRGEYYRYPIVGRDP